MGSQYSTLTTEQVNQNTSTEITLDYQPLYDQCRSNPQLFSDLLTECPCFTKNLIKMFPNAFVSYQHYYDMLLYLRKYDSPNNRHEMAHKNIGSTTLLDRFFMICLGIETGDEFAMTTLSVAQAKELLQYYMQLFLAEPKIENFDKIRTFINMPDLLRINAKAYSAALRQHFPHIQKYLVDYIQLKCRDSVKDGLLLRNFKSAILKEDAVLLSMKISELAKKQATLLYSTETCGLSFHSIQKNIVGYTGYWLLIAEHVQKNEDGEWESYKFGSLQRGPIRQANTFQGDLTGFIFTIHPKIRLMTTDKGQNQSNYFFFNAVDEKISKMRKGLGFGGNAYKQNFKLWIDEDIDRSTTFNGIDPTYGFGSLARPGTQKLNIKVMQIWGLGSDKDLKNRSNYWEEREAEIMKRRKVNKKELIDGNANLVFEKTFAHRDQVYGVIQRKQEQK